jgi:hypothetical protein
VVPTASAPGGKVVIYSTAIGNMVLNGTALTAATENLTPLTALYRAFPGAFLNNGETPIRLPAAPILFLHTRPSVRITSILSWHLFSDTPLPLSALTRVIRQVGDSRRRCLHRALRQASPTACATRVPATSAIPAEGVSARLFDPALQQPPLL